MTAATRTYRAWRAYRLWRDYRTEVPPRSSVTSCRPIIIAAFLDEAEAVREAMTDFSGTPQPGCAAELDETAWSDQTAANAAGRKTTTGPDAAQALLVYANAFDHLHTLGSDGAMPLFSHAPISRVVCEAAVGFAWQLDPSVNSDEWVSWGYVAFAPA